MEVMSELTLSVAAEINSALQTIIGHCDLLEREPDRSGAAARPADDQGAGAAHRRPARQDAHRRERAPAGDGRHDATSRQADGADEPAEQRLGAERACLASAGADLRRPSHGSLHVVTVSECPLAGTRRRSALSQRVDHRHRQLDACTAASSGRRTSPASARTRPPTRSTRRIGVAISDEEPGVEQRPALPRRRGANEEEHQAGGERGRAERQAGDEQPAQRDARGRCSDSGVCVIAVS